MESKEITQQYHIAKSYLDMARAVIDTRIHRQKSNSKNDVINDVIGGFMSCTYVYSYAAIKEWMFASNTAVEVIGYYFDKVNCPRPDWLKKGSIVIPKIEVR